MNRKLISGMFAVVSLFAASMASAATVQVGSSSQVGNVLTLNLVGTGFDAGVQAIGLAMNWDTTLLSAISTSPDVASSAASNGFTNAIFNLVNVPPGSLDVTFATAPGTSMAAADFSFFSIAFTVLTSAPNVVTTAFLSQNVDGAPLNAAGQGYVGATFNNATITLNAVPVPAAVWLLGSGLIGLVGVARRRSATPAIAA